MNLVKFSDSQQLLSDLSKLFEIQDPNNEMGAIKSRFVYEVVSEVSDSLQTSSQLAWTIERVLRKFRNFPYFLDLCSESILIPNVLIGPCIERCIREQPKGWQESVFFYLDYIIEVQKILAQQSAARVAVTR